MEKLGSKDLLTLCNALCGIVGISLAISGQGFAWLYIFPAVLFDFLDGRVARRTKATNEFGKELDSLADTVSFVVAPTVVAMKLSPDVFLTIASALFACTGLLRLAWFNLQKDKRYFWGLPTPFAALIVLLVNAFLPMFTVWALAVSALAMVTPFKLNKL